MAVSQQFCTFVLNEQLFGVRVEQVQEVLRYHDMTRVPLVPDFVRGLINLRGQIVTALDLRRRLGMPDRAPAELPMNVVIRTGDGPVSLLVDAIGEVLEVCEESFEAPPATLLGEARSMVRGVYKLTGQLLLELDLAQALAVTEGGKESALSRA
jgi:purine-binding chemotaxis protein CheW